MYTYAGDASTSHAITLLGHSGQAIENILWQTKRPITQSVAQENSALEVIESITKYHSKYLYSP